MTAPTQSPIQSAPQTRSASTLQQRLLICIGLALLISIAFSRVIQCGFVNYDDPDYVEKNKIVQQGLTWAGVKWALTSSHAANWFPLTWISHMIDCQLHGVNPAGHHVTNVLLHIGSTIVLFLAFRRMTNAPWRSAFVAALFGLHPLHVESVAWLAERKDVLSTFFGMLALLSYARYVEKRSNTAFPLLNYALTFFWFACGLMSKPMLVTFPFVLLLLDFWPLQRINGLKGSSRLVIEKIPFFILSAVSSYITVQVQVGKTVQSLSNFSALDRVSNVLVSYVAYLWKMVWPAKLAFFYPLVSAPPVLHAVIAGIVLIAITSLVWLFARRYPAGIVGWCWYLGTLVPVIGIVHVGEQALADRYTYIPLIGIFIAIAWIVPDLLSKQRLSKAAYWSIAAVLLGSCTIMTFRQVGFWKNSRAMLERALAVTENNFLALNNYGVILADEGRYDEAITHYRKAISIKPTYARAYNNLGTSLTLKGQFQEAIESYQQSLEIRPAEPQTHYNLAVTYARVQRYDLTIEHCREALRLDPNYGAAFYDLALALSLSNQFEEAKTYFNKALEFDPKEAQAHLQLARLYLRGRDVRNAVDHYRAAVRLDPQQVTTVANLVWILSTSEDDSMRNGTEALGLARQVDQSTNGQHPMVLRSLAAAYAETGDFQNAIETAENAMAIANDPQFEQSVAYDLNLYRAGKPCRSR
jgi:tetratricopeptide (TPR) repeat protein